MKYEKEIYKVSNTEDTISIFVKASNPIDALDQAKHLTGRDDLRVAERIEE